jgi:hypothetical protein
MSPSRSPSPVAVVLGLALAFGLAVGAAVSIPGCGPKEKFCANTSDGVCPIPMDATIIDKGVEAPPVEMGSIYVGADGATD